MTGLAELERARAVVKSPGRAAVGCGAGARRGEGHPGVRRARARLAAARPPVRRRHRAPTGRRRRSSCSGRSGAPRAVRPRSPGTWARPSPRSSDVLPDGATVICEASSYQLHDAVAFAPEVGLILNLTPDHLAWHGTLDAYRAAKLRLFEHQGPEHVGRRPARSAGPVAAGTGGASSSAVSRGDDLARARRRARGGRASGSIGLDEIRLAGAHNAWNAAGAAAAALAAGVEHGAGGRGAAHVRRRRASPGGCPRPSTASPGSTTPSPRTSPPRRSRSTPSRRRST